MEHKRNELREQWTKEALMRLSRPRKQKLALVKKKKTLTIGKKKAYRRRFESRESSVNSNTVGIDQTQAKIKRKAFNDTGESHRALLESMRKGSNKKRTFAKDQLSRKLSSSKNKNGKRDKSKSKRKKYKLKQKKIMRGDSDSDE